MKTWLKNLWQKDIKKTNGKTKFLYRQSRYLSYTLKRMLYNSLIQPHFDFAWCDWYSKNLPMSLKSKLQAVQKACIRFCLGMERRIHIGLNYFEKNNWLPVNDIADQCLKMTTYNFKNFLTISFIYVRYIYTLNSSPVVRTRRSLNNFIEPIFVKDISRKSISYLGSKIWNDLDKNIKTFTFTNSFKHFKQFLKTRLSLSLLLILFLWLQKLLLLLLKLLVLLLLILFIDWFVYEFFIFFF